MCLTNYINRVCFDHQSALCLLQAVTVNTNSWTDAGHGASQIYDILYMMGRDDVSVGMGGEGGIAEDGHIFPDVGGFLPIVEQVGLQLCPPHDLLLDFTAIFTILSLSLNLWTQ